MPSKIEVDTVILPFYWACYIINGDCSGMENNEIKMCDKAIEQLAKDRWSIVSTEGEPYFTWSYRLYCPDAGCDGGDVLEYVIHREKKWFNDHS